MTVIWKEIAYKDDCVLIADTDASGYGFFLNEGDMVSDDPLKFPSQQSVKTYVDNNIGGGDDLHSNLIATGESITIEANEQLHIVESYEIEGTGVLNIDGSGILAVD